MCSRLSVSDVSVRNRKVGPEGKRAEFEISRQARGVSTIPEVDTTAVPQLPYTGAEIAEWLFHPEKATLENAAKCTGIVKPL